MLAFSAIRNNDKVGLILFTDEVEKFIPPRKGRRHVLRVIREVLFYEPARVGHRCSVALEFLLRVTPHRAVVVVVSDFIGALPVKALRQCNRRHDVVAVQITDRFELELPALGRLILRDAETGEVVEVNTGDERRRATFSMRQGKAHQDLSKVLRAVGIDVMQLRTDEPYVGALGRFFEARERRRHSGLRASFPR